MTDTTTVEVDVYHVRENGWPCIETDGGRVASGPEIAGKGLTERFRVQASKVTIERANDG